MSTRSRAHPPLQRTTTRSVAEGIFALHCHCTRKDDRAAYASMSKPVYFWYGALCRAALMIPFVPFLGQMLPVLAAGPGQRGNPRAALAESTTTPVMPVHRRATMRIKRPSFRSAPGSQGRHVSAAGCALLLQSWDSSTATPSRAALPRSHHSRAPTGPLCRLDKRGESAVGSSLSRRRRLPSRSVGVLAMDAFGFTTSRVASLFGWRQVRCTVAHHPAASLARARRARRPPRPPRRPRRGRGVTSVSILTPITV